MKNWQKILIIIMGLVMFFPAEAHAALSFSSPSTKTIILAVFAIILILVLYVGFKMDSYDSKKEPKEKKSKLDKINNYISSKDEVYEEDEKAYEMDDINPEEISSNTEYEEDELEELGFANDNSEASLYEMPSDDAEEYEDDEEYGEEFDTSIIDDLDEEELNSEPEIKNSILETKLGPNPIANVVEELKEKQKESFDSTMVFDTPIKTSALENDIDELDDIEEELDDEDTTEALPGLEEEIDALDSIEEKSVSNDVEEDPFIKELQNFKEPESDFEGFSVKTKVEKEEPINVTEEIKEEVIEKPRRKYTKTKKEANSLGEDFLKQMEKNLEEGN